VRAAEASPTEAHSASTNAATTVEGLQRLKHEVHVTVETSALPTGANADAVKPEKKSFQ
jgi:hypothetical protein